MDNITSRMLETFIQNRLKDKSDFLQRMHVDLNKIETNLTSATNQLNKLKETGDNVKILSEKVKHTSLIPLSKNIYFNATIVHTGEYYLDKLAYPESFSVLQTKEQTLELLDKKIKQQCDLIRKFVGMKEQLIQRISLIKGGEISDNDGFSNQYDSLPEEIRSDKGVAVKCGEFYEIFEFDEG